MSNLPPLPEPMAALLWEHLQFDVRNRTDAQLEAILRRSPLLCRGSQEGQG